MDAHVFRSVAHRLALLLDGGRVEKIQSPAPQVCVITCYAAQKKYHLVLRHGRKEPFLFCAPERPVVGGPPTAAIMRLRKYCAGRRIMAVSTNWIERRISLLFQSPQDSTGGTRPPETWLTLDLREGPQLSLDSTPASITSPTEPRWPSPDELPQACEEWRQWPVLTPALRRVLPHMEPLDQAALLADLQEGGGDIFVYEPAAPTEKAADKGAKAPPQIFAWPLPPQMADGRTERIFSDPLEATAALGGVLVLAEATDKARQEAAAPFKREAARLARLLEKINDEEARLTDMCAVQGAALAIQGELWQYTPDARMDSITTQNPAYPEVRLDARYTLRENMQKFFHQAARGRRGLPHVAQRREQLQASLQHALNMSQDIARGAPLPAPKAQQRRQESLNRARWPKGVQGFKSSDGLLILRGRDAKGNAALLKVAAGHDIWLHVEGGPSAHAIIRRSFAGEDIPQRTLHEAGALVAAKSWQKDSPSALILCAQVRHIKPMKGAGTGTVRIDKVWHTFTIAPDSALEERLRTDGE